MLLWYKMIQYRNSVMYHDNKQSFITFKLNTLYIYREKENSTAYSTVRYNIQYITWNNMI